jgi:hypothetical protein
MDQNNNNRTGLFWLLTSRRLFDFGFTLKMKIDFGLLFLEVSIRWIWAEIWEEKLSCDVGGSDLRRLSRNLWQLSRFVQQLWALTRSIRFVLCWSNLTSHFHWSQWKRSPESVGQSSTLASIESRNLSVDRRDSFKVYNYKSIRSTTWPLLMMTSQCVCLIGAEEWLRDCWLVCIVEDFKIVGLVKSPKVTQPLVIRFVQRFDLCQDSRSCPHWERKLGQVRWVTISSRKLGLFWSLVISQVWCVRASLYKLKLTVQRIWGAAAWMTTMDLSQYGFESSWLLERTIRNSFVSLNKSAHMSCHYWSWGYCPDSFKDGGSRSRVADQSSSADLEGLTTEVKNVDMDTAASASCELMGLMLTLIKVSRMKISKWRRWANPWCLPYQWSSSVSQCEPWTDCCSHFEGWRPLCVVLHEVLFESWELVISDRGQICDSKLSPDGSVGFD